VATNTTLSVIFCEMCGDIRQLEAPSMAVPDLETISAEPDAG
jgi:hypothetical protein